MFDINSTLITNLLNSFSSLLEIDFLRSFSLAFLVSNELSSASAINKVNSKE